MFKTRFGEPNVLLLPLMLVPVALLPVVPAVLRPPKLWLKSCQGTGISLPMELAVEPTLGVPVTVERLDGVVPSPEEDGVVPRPEDEGVVPSPEGDVTPVLELKALPADESARMASSMWPD